MSNNGKSLVLKRKYIYYALTLFLGIALSILFFFILYNAKGVNLGLGKVISAIQPFIYGAVIAYILTPLCNYIEKYLNIFFIKICHFKKLTAEKISSILSIFFSLCISLLLIYLLLSMVIPELLVSLNVITGSFDEYYITITTWIQELFKDNTVLLEYFENLSENISKTASTWLTNEVIPSTKTLIASFSTGVMSAVSLLKNFIIGLIVSVYCLKSRKIFAAQANIFVHSILKEKKANKLIQEVKFADRMILGFITGRIVDSAIIGVLCFIGLLILKMPYAVLISVIVGVTNVIPFFGPFIGAIPSAFLILMVDPVKCIWFCIFILILQQIDGNIIGPAIMGEMTNLSSFWVLFALMLFSGLFGFIGMVIGVPIFAVIYHLVQELIMKGLKRTGYIPTSEEADISKLNAYLETLEPDEQPFDIIKNDNIADEKSE